MKTLLIMKYILERSMVMRLDTEECNNALNEYVVGDVWEWLAVKVLETVDEEVVNIPGLMELSDAELDKLAYNVLRIRMELGIEDEA